MQKTVIDIYIYIVEVTNDIDSGVNANTKNLHSFETMCDFTHCSSCIVLRLAYTADSQLYISCQRLNRRLLQLDWLRVLKVSISG